MEILLSFVGLWAFCFVIHCATGADTAADAVYQCSALHQIDLSKLQTNGTDFTVSGCRLKCIIDGKVISDDPVNEGSTCNVPNGICHNGACVHQIAHSTTVGPTSAPTPAPIYPLGYTFTQLNVTVQHAILHDSTLKQTDVLFVEYSHHSRSHAEICETKWYFPVPNLEWHGYGGNNTITETFSSGKPMIVLPLFADQYDNAQRVTEKGYGARLETYTFTEKKLLDTIERLFNDKEMNQKCQAAAVRIANSNSKERAAEQIEQVVGGEEWKDI